MNEWAGFTVLVATVDNEITDVDDVDIGEYINSDRDMHHCYDSEFYDGKVDEFETQLFLKPYDFYVTKNQIKEVA